MAEGLMMIIAVSTILIWGCKRITEIVDRWE